MKTFIFSLAFVAVTAFTVAPVVTNAAMYGYIGDDYKQAADCIPFVDHMHYEIIDGKATVVGCVTGAAWDRSQAEAADLQATGVRYAAGEFVHYLNGVIEQVPYWFNMGWVVPTNLVR